MIRISVCVCVNLLERLLVHQSNLKPFSTAVAMAVGEGCRLLHVCMCMCFTFPTRLSL